MRTAVRIVVCLLAAAQAGCGSYVSQSVEIRSYLAEGRFDKALKVVEKSEGGSSRLLSLYESGLILHFEGKYEESNGKLHEAESLWDDLYTKSLSREAGALLTSDNLLAYRGEPFEAAWIHYYKILNYLHLGDGDGALVECRKLDERLKLFRDEGDTFYRNDPFLEYLTGLVYESQGELGDAWVSYRLALEAFAEMGSGLGLSAPPGLRCDFLRVDGLLGYGEEFPLASSPEPCPPPPNPDRSGAVVLLVETGFVPLKTEEQLFAPLFKDDVKDKDDEFDTDAFSWTLADRVRTERAFPGEVDHWLAVAFPRLVPEPSPVQEVEVVPVEAPASATRAEPVVDLERMSTLRFDERRPGMLAKTLARALAKYLAKEKVEDKKGQLAGIAVNIFNVATERADTRSWSTLPGRVQMARVDLPPGTYTFQIVLRSSTGERIDTVALPGILVEAGRTVFLNHRVF